MLATTTEATESTAIALPESGTFSMQPRHEGAFGFKPMTIFSMTTDQIDRLKLLAEMYHVSTAFSASKSLKTKGDYFLIMLKGLETGIPPMTAVDYIDVIQGKPSLNGKGMLAIIQGSPACEDVTIDDQYDDKVIVTMKRKGRAEPYRVEFGKQEADKFMTTAWIDNVKKSIPLSQKENYQSQPKVMWRWRAISACARLAFPDVIGGMYLSEELNPDLAINEDGEIVTSTAIPSNVTKISDSTGKGSSPQPKQPDPKPAEKGKDNPSEKPASGTEDAGLKPTWLQEDDHKQWLIGTLNNNGLDGEFFKRINPQASGWNDIAKKYTDRKALAKAIFDAMDESTIDSDSGSDAQQNTPSEPAYPNPFDIATLMPDAWSDEAYTVLCNYFEQYFDESAEDIITGDLGVEDYEQEYENPLDLWNDMVSFAVETGVNLIVEDFEYQSSGKNGRIITFHPVLALCDSRNKFIEMIGDDKYSDKHNIANWKEEDNQHLSRPLLISIEQKTRSADNKTYNLITGASIKPLPTPDNPDDIDEFFS